MAANGGAPASGSPRAPRPLTTLPDNSTLFEHTENGRLTQAIRKTSDNIVISGQDLDYDEHGRLQTSTDLRNGATDYAYYSDDRLHTVKAPAADAQSARQVTSYTYAANGQVEAVTQPDSTVVHYTYWPTGALKRQWGSRTYPAEYGYDPQGRLHTLKTWQNFAAETGAATTTWNYDAASGRLLRKLYQDSRGPSYTYKASGRLETRTWQRGIVTTYGYDQAGSLHTITYSDATPPVTITPDRAGRAHEVTDATGTRTLTYTVDGQLELEDFGNAGMFAGVNIHPGYDGLQRRTSLAGTLGQTPLFTIGYTPDTASRLGTVTFGQETATYTYEPNAGTLVHQIDFRHNGQLVCTTTKDHDHLLRLISIGTQNTAGSVLSSHSYAYNAANLRDRATLQDNSYWSYGYDALGQVTAGTKYLSGGTPALGQQFGYSFDDIGNRLTTTVNGRAASYTPNLLNQYTDRAVPGAIDVRGEAVPDANVTVNELPTTRQGRTFYKKIPVENTATAFADPVKIVGVKNNLGPSGKDVFAEETRTAFLPKTPESFVYDDDGNLTQDGQWNYTWDAENQLVAIETRAGLPSLLVNQRLEFTYDYGHRRAEKKVFVAEAAGTYPALPTRWLRFPYDGWNLLAELDGSSANSAIRTYAWGSDLSNSMQGAGGVGGLVFIRQHVAEGNATPSANIPSYDGAGNLLMLVNAETGAANATYEYNLFGDVIRSAGSMRKASSFCFSTKYLDAETAKLYYGSRFLNTSTGRWISRDPLQESASVNTYSFALNSPANWIDSDGRESWNSFYRSDGSWNGPFLLPNPSNRNPLPGPQYAQPTLSDAYADGPSLVNNNRWFEANYPNWVARSKNHYRDAVNAQIIMHCRAKDVHVADFTIVEPKYHPGFFSFWGGDDSVNETFWGDVAGGRWRANVTLGRFWFQLDPQDVKVAYSPAPNGCCYFNWEAVLAIKDVVGFGTSDIGYYFDIADGFPERRITRARWKIEGSGKCCK